MSAGFQLAIVSKGLCTLGEQIALEAGKKFGVVIMDDYFDAEKRQKLTQHCFGFSYVKDEDEKGLFDSVNGIYMVTGNIRFFANIIESKLTFGPRGLDCLSIEIVTKKLLEQVRRALTIIKVVGEHMASQDGEGEFRGSIVNIIDCGNETKSIANMIIGAFSGLTAPLASILKPIGVRINTIIIEPKSTYSSDHQQSDANVAKVISRLIEDPNIHSQNIPLGREVARL
mmetsp:Transcript_25207/g.44119  ORF Transcript_25207/g.44119 Transcript_25207/m.44119 type:complete len:228 (-) Transcript_25207:31-714(-)